jgi:hypothetical protein
METEVRYRSQWAKTDVTIKTDDTSPNHVKPFPKYIEHLILSSLLNLSYRYFPNKILYFYVARDVYFGMKLYNDQRNAQALNLFSIYFYLTCFERPDPDTITRRLEPLPKMG